MADESIQARSLAAAKAQGPRGLGRGLSALLGEGEPQGVNEAADVGGPKSRLLPVAFLKPNRFQPRRFFDEGELK
jgi:ParB family chromosome partitioning protein